MFSMMENASSKRVLYKLFMFALLLLLGGCSENTNKIVEKFPTEKQLKPIKIHNLDSLYSAYSIVTDGNVFLFAQKKKSKFFVVTDNRYNITGELCPAGNGHGEWNSPIATGQFEQHESLPCAYILERSTHSLFLQPTNGEAPTLVEGFKTKDITSIRNVFKINENSFLGTLDDDNCEFFKYDKSTQNVTRFSHPIPDTGNMGDMSHMLLQTLATYNESEQKIAISYYTYPLIIIRDTDGNIKCTLQMEKSLPHYIGDAEADPHLYFKAIKSDDKYIYALYSPDEQSTNDYILVFSWSGDAVAKYAISPAMDFAVDSNGKRFVAIDDETGLCVEYRW